MFQFLLILKSQYIPLNNHSHNKNKLTIIKESQDHQKSPLFTFAVLSCEADTINLSLGDTAIAFMFYSKIMQRRK